MQWDFLLNYMMTNKNFEISFCVNAKIYTEMLYLIQVSKRYAKCFPVTVSNSGTRCGTST